MYRLYKYQITVYFISSIQISEFSSAQFVYEMNSSGNHCIQSNYYILWNPLKGGLIPPLLRHSDKFLSTYIMSSYWLLNYNRSVLKKCLKKLCNWNCQVWPATRNWFARMGELKVCPTYGFTMFGKSMFFFWICWFFTPPLAVE